LAKESDRPGVLERRRYHLRGGAEAAGFAWSATEELIAQAEKALADNRLDAAAALARQALKQARNPIAQSEYADAHWQKMKPDWHPGATRYYDTPEYIVGRLCK